MDLLVLPSINEGFGIVVIEANACGVPVVGSTSGGIPETIGYGGVTVSEGDNFVARFAASCVKLLERPMNRIALNKRIQPYSSSRVIQQEIALYSALLATKIS